MRDGVTCPSLTRLSRYELWERPSFVLRGLASREPPSLRCGDRLTAIRARGSSVRPTKEQPHEITTRDIAAVSAIRVDIPTTTSIWILNDGAAQVRSLLASVLPDQRVWSDDVDLTKDCPLWQLWSVGSRSCAFDEMAQMLASSATKRLMSQLPVILFSRRNKRTRDERIPNGDKMGTSRRTSVLVFVRPYRFRRCANRCRSRSHGRDLATCPGR